MSEVRLHARGKPCPEFTIKGDDLLAFVLVRNYAQSAQHLGWFKLAGEVEKAASEIQEWQLANPEKVHMPEHEHVPSWEPEEEWPI